MPNLGLLGALGGLGQGLVRVGTDMAERRERALQWARQEAARQQERADAMKEHAVAREETRNASFARTAFTTRAADRRQQSQQEFTQRRDDRSYAWRDANREDEQRERENLARLHASLSRANSEAAIRLRENLESGHIVGTQETITRRNPNGTEVVNIRGRTPTGEWRDMGTVTRFPNRADPDSGAPSRSLTARPGG